jgi:hypothetical protein
MNEEYITRDVYKKIKAMNREQMSRYFCDFYDSIFNEKVNCNLDKIRVEVKKISGIGDVKAEQIVEIVKNCIEIQEGDA